jgi:hypothetical protein
VTSAGAPRTLVISAVLTEDDALQDAGAAIAIIDWTGCGAGPARFVEMSSGEAYAFHRVLGQLLTDHGDRFPTNEFESLTPAPLG